MLFVFGKRCTQSDFPAWEFELGCCRRISPKAPDCAAVGSNASPGGLCSLIRQLSEIVPLIFPITLLFRFAGEAKPSRGVDGLMSSCDCKIGDACK